jgi:hypothetical protein
MREPVRVAAIELSLHERDDVYAIDQQVLASRR